jgi:hypothetical protein
LQIQENRIIHGEGLLSSFCSWFWLPRVDRKRMRVGIHESPTSLGYYLWCKLELLGNSIGFPLMGELPHPSHEHDISNVFPHRYHIIATSIWVS